MRAFRVAYDGRPFHGFQRQPDVPTVEDALLDALEALSVVDPDAESDGMRPTPAGYAAAGRTDAGVSALAQTVAFEAPEWLTPAAVNAELPESVRAWAHADAPPAFHATHDAARRRYAYYLHAPDADADLARRTLDRLDGEHDVHNLTPDDAGTRRELATSLTVDGPFLVPTFEAGGFPRQFVRRAAALVELVATGERPLAFVDRVLSDAVLDGPDGVPAAPPEPLVLAAVAYPNLDFTVDADAAAAARAAFHERRVVAAARARVAGRIESGVGDGADASDGGETGADAGSADAE